MSTVIRLGLRERQPLIHYFLPILWVGTLPLGVSIEAIGLVLALVAILGQEKNWSKIKQNLQLPWLYPLLAIIIWTFLGLSWTPKINHESLSEIKKCFSFFLIPILMLGFTEEKQKEQALQTFLIASLIPFAMAIAKRYFAWHFHQNDDPGHLFYNHILTGFLVSYAAYLALAFWFRYKNQIYLLAFILYSYQLLIINTGKMAIVLYLTLVIFSLWRKTPFKQRLYLLGLGLISAILLAQFSPNIHQLVLSLKQEIMAFFQGNKATSFGFRVQFHAFAFTIFKQHWLLGAGPGAYSQLFHTLNPVPAWPYAPNPHSQYWLILAEQGIIGLGLWLWFFIALYKTPSYHAFYQGLWRGFLIILAINGLSDVILFACPSYLLMAIAALSFCPKE